MARGVLTDAEVDAASGTAKDRRAYLAGSGGKRRRRAVLNGVFDLVAELGRSTGRRSERLEFVRGEVQKAREGLPT